MQIDLSSQERFMIIAALREKSFKAKIQDPKTKFLIRQLYKSLIKKLAADEVLHQKMKESIGG